MDTPQVRRACFRAGQPPPGQSVPVLTHGASPVAVQLAGAPHPFVHSPCPPEHENPTFFQGSITDELQSTSVADPLHWWLQLMAFPCPGPLQ